MSCRMVRPLAGDVLYVDSAPLQQASKLDMEIHGALPAHGVSCIQLQVLTLQRSTSGSRVRILGLRWASEEKSRGQVRCKSSSWHVQRTKSQDISRMVLLRTQLNLARKTPQPRKMRPKGQAKMKRKPPARASLENCVSAVLMGWHRAELAALPFVAPDVLVFIEAR